MANKNFNNWIMYYEINKLQRLGLSSLKIGRYIGLDARTVNKYLQMSEQEYEQYLLLGGERNKVLSQYEDFVKGKLTQFQDTSAAQIHDWLKEHHPDLPNISQPHFLFSPCFQDLIFYKNAA